MPVTFEKFMERFTPEERAEINRRADVLVAESRTLAQLRKGANITQEKMARRLKTSQANISEIESKRDVLVSTIARVVKGVGGRLLLYAEMPDGSRIPLTLGRAPRKSAKASAQPRKAAPAPSLRNPPPKKRRAGASLSA
jgi:transcriptional regulator with XRE-family HTH domain